MTATLRIAVLDDYQGVALSMADWSPVGEDAEVVPFAYHLAGEDEAVRALADFDVVCMMRERMRLTGDVIARLPRLKLIIFTGPRTDAIDLEAAADRGIPVCNTASRPGVAPAGELTWALVLACARNLPAEFANAREGRWQTTVGTELHGKVLGLLGLGSLGAVVARYGRAFGMEVIAWSQNLTDARAAEQGATRVEKDELFARSDVLSIHLKLSDRSQGLVGARELSLMKPTAMLINTSRGPIVDEAALLDALRGRRIAMAGLDVFDTEPLPADHPIRALDNAVITSHIGYVTGEAYRNFFGGMVEDIAAWRAGAPIRLYPRP